MKVLLRVPWYGMKFKAIQWVLNMGMQLDFKLNEVIEGNKKIMSAIADFAAKVEANFAQIKAGIQSLDDKIQALQNSQGTLSATDQAALDQISSESAQLAAAAEAGVTPPAPPA